MVTIFGDYESGQETLIFAPIDPQNLWGPLLSFWPSRVHNIDKFDR